MDAAFFWLAIVAVLLACFHLIGLAAVLAVLVILYLIDHRETETYAKRK